MPFSDLFNRKKGKGKDKNPSENLPETTHNLAEPLPFGLLELAKGVNPIVDIVAVHGLNGHREKTWTSKDGVNWLKDPKLLPAILSSARIFSWGYDANTHSKSHVTVQYLYDHATTLVSDLSLERQLTDTERRPIIFIAHSLGGIVVKSALIHSDSARKGHLEAQRAIKLSTYGLFFLGTPHQGGEGVTWGTTLLNVASIFVETNKTLLPRLQRDSEWLQQQLQQYAAISNEFVTKFAYESYPTTIALGKSLVVVPKSSAIVPGAVDAESIAIMADHINMVKFSSAEDNGFRKVSGHLQLMVKGCAAKIETNQENKITEEGQ